MTARRSWRVDRRLPAVVLLTVIVLGGPVAPAAARAQEEALADEVTAAGAVLWDPLDDRVLWGRAPTTPLRMASTTKIMTALLAVEAGTLTDTVTVSTSAAAADDEPGAASLDLRPGQRIGMRSLLTALMMRSGNDAAAAVAAHVAGSEDAFVAAMNERARRLGLRRTRFLDATGLSDSASHHASPLDLARLAEAAMATPGFAALVGTYRAEVPGFGTLTSRNLLLDRYRGATGVKTGYTALAGLCLVGSATRDGRTYYTAVLDSEDTFADTAVMLDHAFEAFAVASADDASVGVYRTAAGEVALRIADATARTVPAAATVRVRSSLLPTPPERIATGTRLGRAELVVDGEVVDTAAIESTGALSGAATGSPAASAGAAVEDAVRAFARVLPRRAVVRTGG